MLLTNTAASSEKRSLFEADFVSNLCSLQISSNALRIYLFDIPNLFLKFYETISSYLNDKLFLSCYCWYFAKLIIKWYPSL